MTHADQLYGVIFTGICSLVLIILLVYQKDLGTALIFFVIYVTLIYISTNKSLYFFGGLAAGSIGAFVAYKFYAHVQYRVEAWLNPWADVDKRGYQIAQSLFAIGAGGWFGYGLTKGMPKVIPAVPTDFIFAAICEEFGNIFSILLIVMMALFFIEGIRIAKEAEEGFYLLVASGISCIFAFQTFLIIGGVTKFIPITGVTLPFMSSGGTSLVMSIIMLGILEGIHMHNQEGESNGKKKNKKSRIKIKKTINNVSYIFIGLFALLVVHIIIFIVFDSANIVINSYNPRLEEIEENIIRGKITDQKGNVLAETVVDGDSEYRVYPYENIFAHIIGYSHYGKKTGIEALVNYDLLKSNVSILDKTIQAVSNQKSVGNNAVTTLDADMQKTCL